MSEFKSQAEIIKWLADGGAIRVEGQEPVFLKEDGSFNTDKTIVFNNPELWFKAKKPRPKKSLKPFLIVSKDSAFLMFFESINRAEDYVVANNHFACLETEGIPDQVLW